MLINIAVIFGSVISLSLAYGIFRLLFSEISAVEESPKQKNGLAELIRANDLSAAVYDEHNSIENMDIADNDDLHLLSNFQTREENAEIIRQMDQVMSERADPERFDDLHTLSSFHFYDPPVRTSVPRRTSISLFRLPKRDIIRL